MTMSKMAAAVAGALLGLGAAGMASALEITAGEIKFTIDNYDAGTTGYGDFSGVKCTTVAECDAVAGISTAPGAIGSEDTWGIFSVALISNITTGQTLFTKGTDGYLTGVFYGIDDTVVDVQCGLTGCNTTALATGGKVDLYKNLVDYDPTGGAAARTGLATYPGITPGTELYLSADFVPGANAFVPTATYQNTFNNTSFAGNGQGFLSITGGTAASLFDTDALTTAIGTTADLFLDVTFNDVNGAASDIGWTVTSAGQVKGEVQGVPEPGVLALLGLLGLAGGLVTRRKA